VPNKQLTFDGLKTPNDAFGGSQFANCNPKTKRPLHSKFPMHVILKGRKGILRNPKVYVKVNAAFTKLNQKYGHRMYDYSNNGNHIHASLKLSNIHNWTAYIRELSSAIVRVLRAAKLLDPNEKFWLYRPYTRIVRGWKKAFLALKQYIRLNKLEAEYHLTRDEAQWVRQFEDKLNLLPP